MKLLSLALVASGAVSGYAYAQTAAQTPAPSAATTPGSSSSSSGSQSLGHACKEEVKKLCGRAHGQEIKSGLDLNKFFADCKTKLSQSAKPNS